MKHLDIANDNHKRLAHELLKDDFEAAIYLQDWDHLPTIAQVRCVGTPSHNVRLISAGICAPSRPATFWDLGGYDDSELLGGALFR